MSYVYYIKKHFTNNNFSEYAFSFVLVLHNLHIPNSNTGLKQIHNAHAWQHTYETTYKYIEEWKTNLMSLSILFHFLCTQHVSDINISIIRSLRLCCWITTSVVLFSVRCVLEIWCGWFWVVPVLQAEACNTDAPSLHGPDGTACCRLMIRWRY